MLTRASLQPARAPSPLHSMRVAVLAAIGLSLAGAGPAAAQTVPEAVDMALATNPGLQALRATAQATRERRVQARAGGLPQVSAEAASGYATTWSRSRSATTGVIGAVTDTDNQPSSVSIVASQPLWTGGRVAAALEQADAQIALADARVAQGEIAVMRDVVTAYADLRRDLTGVEVRAQNARLLSRQLEAAQARFEVGEITRTDVAQVQARLSGTQAALSGARARFEASRTSIERLIGQPPTSLSPDLPVPPLPASLDQALVLARSENPDIVIARLGERAARSGAAAARAETRPRASVSASASGLENQGFDGNRGGSVGITARLTVPLYTSGLNTARVREAEGAATAARLSAADAERLVVERVSNAWRSLDAARESVAATDAQIAAARIAFEGAELEQSVGLRTTLDVLIQQQELLDAELAGATARRDLAAASVALSAAIGLLEPGSLTTAESPLPAPAAR